MCTYNTFETLQPITLTPVVFYSSYIFGRPFVFKKTVNFEGTFVRVWGEGDTERVSRAKGDVSFSGTPCIAGHFERNGHKKVTFLTNPLGALENPLRVTFSTSLPVSWHLPVEVNFATLPPPS